MKKIDRDGRIIAAHDPPPSHTQWIIRGGSAKMKLFHKPLIYVKKGFFFLSNKTWPLKNLVLREVFKLFKCYVLFKNFDRKPAISLKTLKIGFFNTLL